MDVEVENSGILIAFALGILIPSMLAMGIKLMIFALALDDWWELRNLDKQNPERMVADDEVVASAGRVVAVGIVIVISLVWLLQILHIVQTVILFWILLVGLLALSLMSVAQGVRALMFRRSMARVMSNTRRPKGVEDVGAK